MKRKIARVFLELMRHHITAMAIISVVNMILIITGSKYIIYFSALLPQFLTARGFSMALTSGYAPLETIAVVLGAICVILLLLTVLFSYKHRLWHLVAAGLVLADLSIALVMLFGEGNMSFLPDAVINGYIALVTVGAFFVSGALYPKLKAVKEDETDGEEEPAVAEDMSVGYGEYIIPAVPVVEAVSAEETAEAETESAETAESAESAPDAIVSSADKSLDKSELEKGVLLKVTFCLPTLKTLKETIGIVQDEDEEK